MFELKGGVKNGQSCLGIFVLVLIVLVLQFLFVANTHVLLDDVVMLHAVHDFTNEVKFVDIFDAVTNVVTYVYHLDEAILLSMPLPILACPTFMRLSLSSMQTCNMSSMPSSISWLTLGSRIEISAAQGLHPPPWGLRGEPKPPGLARRP